MNEFMLNHKRRTANQLINPCILNYGHKIIAAVFHFMKTACENIFSIIYLMSIMILDSFEFSAYLEILHELHVQHRSIVKAIAKSHDHSRQPAMVALSTMFLRY